MVAPAFKITVNGEDVTLKIQAFIVGISVTDNEKNEADELIITVSKKFQRPSYKDELKIWLGYGDSLTFAGLYYVQTTSIANNKILTINATGVDFSSALKEKRNLNYDATTLLKLAGIIAKRHALRIKSNADILIDSVQQNNESDINLLTRLARAYNLIFNVKNNTIYLMQKSAVVPQIKIDINKCNESEIAYSNKRFYKSCKAIYHNTKLNKKVGMVAGSGRPVLIVRKQFANDDEALDYAKNALVRANKSTVSGSLSISGKVVFAGSKLVLGEESYQITKVHHALENSWQTTLNFESLKKGKH